MSCIILDHIFTEDQQSSSSLTVESMSPSESAAPLTPLKPKQLEKLLRACNIQIHALLHMDIIFPYLVQENLLTQGEKEKLCGLSSTFISDDAKIDYLVEKVLPKKGKTSLSRFVKCLECTASGTAHIELADFIKSKAYEMKEEDTPLHEGMHYFSSFCAETILSWGYIK